MKKMNKSSAQNPAQGQGQVRAQMQAQTQAQLRLREQQQRLQQQQQQQQQPHQQQEAGLEQQKSQWQKQQKLQQPPQMLPPQAPQQFPVGQQQQYQQQAYQQHQHQGQQEKQPFQEQQAQQQAHEQPLPSQRYRPVSNNGRNEKLTQHLTGDTMHSFAAATPHHPNELRMLLHMHQGHPTNNIHSLSIPRRDPLGPHLLQLCEALDILFRFDWNFVYWHKCPLPTDPDNKIPIVLRWTDTFSEVQLPGPQGGTIALEDGGRVEMVSWVRDTRYVQEKHLELGLEDWEKVYVVTTMQRCKREVRIEWLQEEQEWKDWNTELQVQALTLAKRIEASEVELSWLREAYRIVEGDKKRLEEKLRIAEMMEGRSREWIQEHGGLNALGEAQAYPQDQAHRQAQGSPPAPPPAHGPAQSLPIPTQGAGRTPVGPPLRSPAQAVESAFEALLRAANQAQAEEAEAEARRSLHATVEDAPDSEENWKQQDAEHRAEDEQEDVEDGEADDQEEVSVCEAEYGSDENSEDESADEMDTAN